VRYVLIRTELPLLENRIAGPPHGYSKFLDPEVVLCRCGTEKVEGSSDKRVGVIG
jgi:hypothetical protein